MLKYVASYARKSLLKISTQNKCFVRAIALENLNRIENVYDLEVEEDHEYFANGILVHNCIDAFRYILNLAGYSNLDEARPLTFEQRYKTGTPELDLLRKHKEEDVYGDIDDYLLNG